MRLSARRTTSASRATSAATAAAGVLIGSRQRPADALPRPHDTVRRRAASDLRPHLRNCGAHRLGQDRTSPCASRRAHGRRDRLVATRCSCIASSTSAPLNPRPKSARACATTWSTSLPPDEIYSAARYANDADRAIADIVEARPPRCSSSAAPGSICARCASGSSPPRRATKALRRPPSRRGGAHQRRHHVLKLRAVDPRAARRIARGPGTAGARARVHTLTGVPCPSITRATSRRRVIPSR